MIGVLGRSVHFAIVVGAGLGDAVRNEIDHIEARHALLLQQEDRVRLGLMEHRDEHLRTVDLGPSGRLRVQRGALQSPLHPGCIMRLEGAALGQALDLFIEVLLQLLAQRVEIGAAMLQHVAGGDVVQHRVEHVLETDIFMAPVERLGHRKLQGDLQFAANHHA